MKLQTNPKVVSTLAKEREDTNLSFRSFLKELDLKGEELDAIVHQLFKDISSQIDCCSCGNCCREISPVLFDDDIKRLASGLDITAEEVVSKYLTRDEGGAYIFNQRPCPMLEGTICRAYDYRPSDCRSFPHLYKGNFRSHLIQAVGNCSVCPIVFNVFEHLKEKLWHR